MRQEDFHNVTRIDAAGGGLEATAAGHYTP
jgi:hypothetical protein